MLFKNSIPRGRQLLALGALAVNKSCMLTNMPDVVLAQESLIDVLSQVRLPADMSELRKAMAISRFMEVF